MRISQSPPSQLDTSPKILMQLQSILKRSLPHPNWRRAHYRNKRGSLIPQLSRRLDNCITTGEETLDPHCNSRGTPRFPLQIKMNPEFPAETSEKLQALWCNSRGFPGGDTLTTFERRTLPQQKRKPIPQLKRTPFPQLASVLQLITSRKSAPFSSQSEKSHPHHNLSRTL